MADPRPPMPAGDTEIQHRLGPYEAVAATRFGPRLIGLRRDDSPEILVRLSPEVTIENGRTGTYRFRGGHRLWVSPEIPDITYASDDQRCVVTTRPGLLTISGPPDRAGFQKELHLGWDGTRLAVDHTLRWTGDEPIEVAPWAITQLPLGGVAILPVRGVEGGPPMHADRSIVVWPYSSLDDARISLREQAVLIRGAAGPSIKLGSGPAPGGLGYLNSGHLFTKTFEPASGGAYPDRAAVGQVYVNESFCELESVGHLAMLEPGAEIRHQETWDVSRCPDLETALERSSQWGLR